MRFLILAPIAFAIYRYNEKPWLSVSAYLCLTFFYTSLSFIRQSLAVSVLILAYGFMKKRKIVPVLIFGVIAALFHYTAAIFIPLYLLSLLKVTKKSLIVFGSVSVGTLIICLVMKAFGANPLNLAAKLVTAVTGKDYTGYIDSKWFETGFGVQYLIIPLLLLAFVLISYFLGWEGKARIGYAFMAYRFQRFNLVVYNIRIYS